MKARGKGVAVAETREVKGPDEGVGVADPEERQDL